MKASIIINNYNYGRFLDDAISSALTQTWPNKEVIVVDDGSTDDSRDVINRYNGKIRAIFRVNGGQAAAMNAGFAESTGAIIWFLDADDQLQPDALEVALKSWDVLTAVGVTRLTKINAEGAHLGDTIPSRTQPLPSGDVRPDFRKTGSVHMPPTSALIFGRWALEKVMPMPEAEYRVCADLYLFTKASFIGNVALVSDNPLGCYRVHGKNSWVNRKKTDRGFLKTKLTIMRTRAALVAQCFSEQGEVFEQGVLLNHTRLILDRQVARGCGLLIFGEESRWRLAQLSIASIGMSQKDSVFKRICFSVGTILLAVFPCARFVSAAQESIRLLRQRLNGEMIR